MSAHEELVERCAKVLLLDEWPESDWEYIDRYNPARTITYRGHACAVLAEVLRTLETVTPEMWDALPPRGLDFDEAYLAMLRASPLNPPKEP